MEHPNYFDGGKNQDVDTWLFQVCEHLEITVIPEHGQVLYATSLFHGNDALWWREVCKSDQRPGVGMTSAVLCVISTTKKI